MHICISKLNIICSDNGLSPGGRQAIIWTNAGILLIQSLETNTKEIFIKLYIFSFKKMHLKMLSGNWQPFCLNLNVLSKTHWCFILWTSVMKSLNLHFSTKFKAWISNYTWWKLACKCSSMFWIHWHFRTWMSNYIPHIKMNITTCTWPDWKWHVSTELKFCLVVKSNMKKFFSSILSQIKKIATILQTQMHSLVWGSFYSLPHFTEVCLFLEIQLTVSQHWFWYWFATM